MGKQRKSNRSDFQSTKWAIAAPFKIILFFWEASKCTQTLASSLNWHLFRDILIFLTLADKDDTFW